MRYDQAIIDQVQSAHEISELIGQYVKLKRSGRNLKGLCPFHGEKTPSFMVNTEKQIFHCFGCGVGGDVFGFVMRHENISFPEAVRMLAERAGITLPQISSKKDEGASEKEQLYEIYRIAADFYHERFKHPVLGKEARAYFEKRGYDMKVAEEFKIGLAPEGWRELFEYLSKKGYSDTVLLRAGLINRSPKGHSYDSFRGRILFPICNLQGKVVAFGGRLLKGEDGPKYLNSSENPVFQKRRELFGLHLARKFVDREHPRILVVEGYFDFLGLYHAGFKSTVATLGTALGDDHVQLLKRFAEEAIVVYDGDKAGEAASLRGLEIFLEGGMNVKIATMPPGFDPDDFVKQKGVEAFQKVLDEAQDFFDYKLQILLKRYNRLDSLGLMKITGDFMETFSKVQNPVLTDRYLRRLAASMGVDENSLRTELQKLKKKNEEKGSAASERERKNTPAAPAAAPASTGSREEELLLFLTVEDQAIRSIAFEQLHETDFPDPSAREAFRVMLQMHQAGEKIEWPSIISRFTNESFRQRFVAISSLDWADADKKRAFEDCLKVISRKKTNKRLEELRRLIARAEQEKNSVQLGQFMEEYQSLWKQRV